MLSVFIGMILKTCFGKLPRQAMVLLVNIIVKGEKR